MVRRLPFILQYFELTMCPQKQTKRTFDVNGKIYQSLAELAREADISYNAAVKRQQRGFSDYEIFFGKSKPSKVGHVRKNPSKSRSVTINGTYYDSIKAAYNAIQPKASYNTVKQRISANGWSAEEAFEIIFRKKKESNIEKKFRKPKATKSYVVDEKEFHSV